jgi:hypothetical protein
MTCQGTGRTTIAVDPADAANIASSTTIQKTKYHPCRNPEAVDETALYARQVTLLPHLLTCTTSPGTANFSAATTQRCRMSSAPDLTCRQSETRSPGWDMLGSGCGFALHMGDLCRAQPAVASFTGDKTCAPGPSVRSRIGNRFAMVADLSVPHLEVGVLAVLAQHGDQVPPCTLLEGSAGQHLLRGGRPVVRL